MRIHAKRPQSATEAVCRIVVKVRRFEVADVMAEADPDSNPADVRHKILPAEFSDDPVYDELASFIHALDVDEQIDLVALMWVGRGDFKAAEWGQAVALASQEHNEHTTEYLLGTPLLADYLEEGLSQFGLSCLGFEMGRL